MDSHNSSREPVEAYIAPTGLLHNALECRGVGKIGKRIRQVVIFLDSLSDNGAEQGREPVKIEAKQATKELAGRMADFQAYNAPAWTYNAQHLAKSLLSIAQVPHHKRGTAAIHAVIGQINMFGIANAQFDAILQAQACQLLSSHFEHFGCDIHADHARTRPGAANDGDGKISRTRTEVQP